MKACVIFSTSCIKISLLPEKIFDQQKDLLTKNIDYSKFRDDLDIEYIISSILVLMEKNSFKLLSEITNIKKENQNNFIIENIDLEIKRLKKLFSENKR